MKTAKIFFIVLILGVAVGGFSFPEVDHYGYYGRISYSGNNYRLGYIINRYNDQRQKVREEIYDAQGGLIKYKTFEYGPLHLMTREAEYNRNQSLMKELIYKYKNGRVQQKIIKETGRHPLYVDFEYSYYRNRLLYQLETFYYNTSLSNRRNNLIKKTVYTYKNVNEKLVEHYRKNGNNRSSRFIYYSAQLFKYNGEGRIDGILLLDQDRRPTKYYEYRYKGYNKIWRINVYKARLGSALSSRGLDDITKMDLSLKHTVIYEYKKDKFNLVKELNTPYLAVKEEPIEEKREPAAGTAIPTGGAGETAIIVTPKTVVKKDGEKKDGDDDSDDEEGDDEEGDDDGDDDEGDDDDSDDEEGDDDDSDDDDSDDDKTDEEE